jgi:hypothetical protein
MMFSPNELIEIAREFERLGVPSHDGGRLHTFDSAELSGRETLRRLRALPDGAGIEAVNRVLLTSE